MTWFFLVLRLGITQKKLHAGHTRTDRLTQKYILTTPTMPAAVTCFTYNK